MIRDTAGEIDEIIRNGGDFWIVEVTGGGCDPEPRVWLRNTDRESMKIDLAGERSRRPDLTWTPKRVWVETEVEEP
jgi:hypothetical protein